MRLRVGSETTDLDDTKAFAEWILNVGNATIAEPNDGEATVEIPEDILIKDEGNLIGSIVSSIYLNFLENLSNPTYFQERAILAPTHDVVDIINNHMMDLVPRDEKVYLSSDSICESDQGPDFNIDMYTPDFLNNIKVGGLPIHKLCLKKDMHVMLLRNIDQPGGLCNGTRLRVIRLGDRIIEAEIISGSNIGMETYIPRMLLCPSDKRIPFKFQRRQFPLVPCFAMTINKSQGQSLSQVGLFLQRPVFTHGQLYVALSRVKSKKGLKVLITDKDGKLTNSTTNVVYKEVLQDL